MKHFFTTRLLTCLAVLSLLWPALAVQAQTLTQADFTGVVVPQYLSNGNNSGSATFPGPRLAVAFRATVSNLTASTLYRYYVQAATASEFGNSASGAGVVLSATPGTTPATTTYAGSSTGSLSTAGSYATFTTDASGSYTGWFFFVNSNNATRFQVPGTVLFPTITLATDAVPATVVARRALNQSITLLGFLSGAGATNGTLLTGSSSATPNNVVFTYDNVAGTGRPLSGAVVESIGVATGTTQTGANAYTYSTTSGSYTTVIPNTLATGVRRVEERSVVTGAVLNCNSDADGVWPSGANTVNPVGGTTAVVLTATDTPLNAGCNAAPTAAITATPATLTAFATTVGTPSATQTVTVGGSALTADITVTAPAGYEVSLSATTGFAATVTVAQTGGTAASTPVYVRLTGTAVGSYAGNVALTSAGATTQNVAVTGTVTAATTPAPTITSFTPTSGAVGATVTITGTDFTGATAVTLNGVAITGFTVVNATTITFTVPTGATSGTIAVTTPSGTATSTGTFTVAPAVVIPVISAIAPNAQVAGGPALTLTVTGTGFTATSTVNFNGVAYTPTSSTATTLVVTIPASVLTTAGSFPVTVTNTAGTSNAFTFVVSNPSTAGAFENFETGTKTSYTTGDVTLNSGSWNFNNALLGTSFADKFNGLQSARIRGGGSIAMNFDKTTGAGIVTVNAALYGSDAVASFILEVSTNGGTTYTTVAGAPTALTATLTPYTFTVNQAGNVRFRISSTNTVAASNPRIIIDDISITNFTAPAVPTITSFTPATGGPGTAVTITGTNFTGATAVRIGSFNVTNFTVVSATSITLVVPSGTGSVNGFITVVTPGGTATSASTFNLVSATLASHALPGLTVFPNPATDRITVVLPQSGAATVALRDLTGRLVLVPATLAADQQLRLPAALASGMYLLEVRQGSVTAIRRIEKN